MCQIIIRTLVANYNFNFFFDIILHSLIGYFEMKTVSSHTISILGLVAGFGLVMEKPYLDTIFNDLLRMENRLRHGSTEDSVVFALDPLIWSSFDDFSFFGWPQCHRSHVHMENMTIGFCQAFPHPRHRTGSKFCIRKIVTLRHFCKLFNIHHFLPEERQTMDEHQISDQGSRSALICLHKNKERYITFSSSGCWTDLGNLMNNFFFIWTCMSEFVWTTASKKDFHNFRKLGVYPFA